MTIQVVSTTEPAVQAEKPADAGEGAQSAPEAKASEQKESTESDTEETEAKEGEEKEESTESEPEDGEDKEDVAAKDKPKKKGGFQRRIDKLNAAKAAAQQEAEYWKQQALKGASESKKDPVETETTATGDGEPNPDDFDTHAKYVKALTSWMADQKLNERDQKLEKHKLEIEQKRVQSTYLERAKSFAEKTSDFDDVLADVDDVALSPTVRGIILESENGPEIAYALAKDRAEFEKINQLGPIAAARAIGKIEAQLSKASEANSQETKKITKAPKPLDPVGGSGKGLVHRDLSDPNIPQAEYERIRRKQLERKGA